MLKNSFIKHNAIAFVGSISVAALNYLYHPVIGRLMRLEDFGEVEVIISLFLQMGIFFSAFSVIVVNVVANTEDEKKRNHLVSELERFALYIILALGGFMLIFSQQLGNFLQFNSHLSILALPIILALSVPVIFRTAYLQGHKDFVGTALIGAIGAISKLLFSVVLILIGFRTLGAVFAIILASFISLWFAVERVRRYGFKDARRLLALRRVDISVIKPQLKYAGFVLVVIFIMTLLFSGDVIVVKHYFSPEVAGLYAGIATIARIIFFATSSVIGVLQASVKIANSDKENQKILWHSFLLVLAIGGSALLVFSLLPTLVTTLLLGARFAQYAYLLPKLGLAILLISIANLFSYYLISLRRKFVVVATIAGAVTTFGLLYLYHSDLPSIIRGMTYGSMLILLLLIAGSSYRFMKQRTN